VLKVIQEYRIGRQIGFFMLNNTLSNDTCIDYVLHKIYLYMNEKQHLRHHLQCLGHIINLIAQIYLLEKKAEETLDELELAHLRKDFEKIAAI